MKFNFLIKNIMSKKAGILTAIATVTALSTAPVSADTNNQVLKQKTEQIACATKLACEALSHTIQAQIDELESKGFRNLTREEKIRYEQLSDELIAVEKSETKHNENLIAVENNKQKEQDRTITESDKRIESDLQEVKSRLSSIEGSLL